MVGASMKFGGDLLHDGLPVEKDDAEKELGVPMNFVNGRDDPVVDGNFSPDGYQLAYHHVDVIGDGRPIHLNTNVGDKI